MARPLLASSIQELEALYRNHSESEQHLRALHNELTHRKTERAAKLRSQVEERLAELNSEPPSRAQHSQGPPPVTPRQNQSRSRPVERQPIPPPTPRPDTGRISTETRRAETRTSAPSPFPQITNRPEDILSAWTALEVLSPPAYNRREDLAAGDRMRVAPLASSALPWERGEKSRTKYRLYYQIILGSIKMEPAVGRLIERYGDTRPERPASRGKAVLAAVVVDSQGRLVESPAVGVSSFGWGVISALNGELADLAGWPDVESRLAERTEKILLGATGDEDEDELKELRARPLTREALLAAYEALVRGLGLPPGWVEPPEFAVRYYVYFKDPNPPEPLLLNSFFLDDLSLARGLFADGSAPRNLRIYLGAERPRNRRDLLQDTNAMSEAVSPGLPRRRGGRGRVAARSSCFSRRRSTSRSQRRRAAGCWASTGRPGPARRHCSET